MTHTPADPNQNSERTTGWEKADKVAHGAGAVAHGIGWVILKIYAVVLIVIGGAILFTAPDATKLIGLGILAYGIYLVAPGSKFVVY